MQEIHLVVSNRIFGYPYMYLVIHTNVTALNSQESCIYIYCFIFMARVRTGSDSLSCLCPKLQMRCLCFITYIS